MNSSEIKSLADENLMGTYGHFNAALVSGKGAVLYDAEGKSYVDFTSGIGVNALGYGDEKWVEAVSRQAAELQHTSNLYYNPTVAKLAETLCKKSGFSRVFLCNSGAEANEASIKLARKYSFDKYGEGRAKIITLRNSFHGRTMETLTATGQDALHNYFFPFPDGFGYVEAGDIEALKNAADDAVCAVMMEPIQGEGGVLPLDKEYVKAVAEFCREKDILLIFDEVQTGVGRTGKLYAWENFDVKPDILSSAKGLGGGLPMGACLCTEKCAETLSAGTHGSTFGGNPIACAGALEVLNRLDDEFLTEVTRKGEKIRSALEKMNGVKSVRGMGLMIGIELEEKAAKDVAAECVENGLLILTAKTLLRILAPLVITDEEIDKGLTILSKVLSD